MWKIVPRDEKFFDQIEQLSHLAKFSAQLMNDLVGRFPTADGLPDQIDKAKMEASATSRMSCMYDYCLL
jgi:hypothetical protein